MSRRLCVVCVILCSSLFVSCTSDKSAFPLERFDYQDVRLTSGRLKSQQDEVMNQYLSIPDDDLLKGFRERAGLPAPGNDMGGWYSAGTWHAFGQYLSGLSRLYAATGNEACRDKVIRLIDAWAETIAPDGFFFYKEKPQGAHYVYEKTQAGLLDAYLFAGYEPALGHMAVITDWAKSNLPADRAYAQTGSEWYTLSENLYRAYEATGDRRYYDFAEFWEYTRWWDEMREKQDVFKDHIFHHAYSHLNTISGAAMAYRVKGDEKYLETARNAWDFFVDSQCYITGGFGPIEQVIHPDDRRLVTNTTHHNFEVQCGSWAGCKLSKYLLEFTGDGRYGDWIEKLLVNGIGASIKMTDDGYVMYYADYNCQYSDKHNYNKSWTCCTGTRPQAVADYVNLIYFKGKDGIYVNCFEPSTLRWGDVLLEQYGNFPESPSTSVTIKEGSGRFTLSFRIPSWLAGEMTVMVNGERADAVARNGWMKVRRFWKKGDNVEVIMPMSFRTERLHPDHAYPVAMAYGPVALVVTTGEDKEYPLSFINSDAPGKGFVPAPELGPLTWRVENHPEWTVKGYLMAEEGERFNMYIDPKAPRMLDYNSFNTKGPWNSRSFYRTGRKGASISATFEGEGIIVYCYRMKDGGKASVDVDGRRVGTIDCYAPGSRIISDHKFTGLGPGKHEITITLLGKAVPESTGTGFYLLGMETVE